MTGDVTDGPGGPGGPGRQGAPRPASDRRTRPSPERIAAVLTAIVVLVLAGLGASLAAQPRPGDAPPTDPAPAQPTSTPARPSGTPAPTSPPVDQAAVRRLAEANSQLGTLQAELEAALEGPAPSSEIADILRRSNTVLTGARAAVELLAAEPSARSLARRLDAVYEAALGASRQTLQASLSNARAYRTGAQDLLAALEPLAELDRSLRALLEPSPA